MRKDLKFIKEVEWEEVFAELRKREANRPEWQECATKVKGFSDWEEWRRFMADQFQASKRLWEIYEVLQPNTLIPQFQVGPFQGWHTLNYFKDSQVPMEERTMDKLVELFQKELLEVKKITGLMRDFPSITQFIGIRFPNDQLVCMEGTHRGAAVTLAKHLGQPIDFSQRQVTIALTDFAENERDILSEMLQKGSNKVKT